MDDEKKGKLIKYTIWGVVAIVFLVLLVAIYVSFSKDENSTKIQTEKSITLTSGDKYNLNNTSGNYVWSSSNKEIAIVTETGEIEGLKEGDAVITLTSENEIINYKIHVDSLEKSVNLTGVKMASNTIEIEKEEKYTMNVKILPENATNTELTWHTSNEDVATVENGVITAVGSGSCMITVKSSNGNVDTCLVKVKGSENDSTVEGEIENIVFDTSSMVLKSEIVYPLIYKVLPEGVEGTITWESSDEEVAKVEDGVIETIGTGTTAIVARSGEVESTMYITVVEGDEETPDVIDDGKEIEVTDIVLNQEEITLGIGDGYSLLSSIEPAVATDKNVTWESSDEEVVTVDNFGNITAVSEGEAVVSVMSSNGITASCYVYVVTDAEMEDTPEEEQKISLSLNSVSLNINDTVQLTETITPVNSVSEVMWESSNSNVARVTNGLVTAVGSGTANISATLPNGETASCIVSIANNVVKVLSVSLNAVNVNLKLNGTTQLTAKVLPSNASNKTITWTSSDPNIATVDSNGKVTAKKAGTALIKARTSNGITASATINVISDISLNQVNLSLNINETFNLVATTSNNRIVTWKSNDPTIATVDSNGKVTAKKAGSTTITATISGNSVTCKVNVSNAVEKLEVHMIYMTDSDAMVIRSATQTVIVDSGHETMTKRYLNYLKDLGIKKVDAFIPTHYHGDHTGGVSVLFKNYTVDKIYVQTENFKNAQQPLLSSIKSRKTIYAPPDTVIDFNGEFQIKMVGPIKRTQACINGTSCDNTDSINFILTYKDTKFFFGADYVQSSEIIKRYSRAELSDMDFVKQPHHGMFDYISKDLIDIMRPKIVFVPTGGDHLSSNMKSWYKAVGAKIYKTSEYKDMVAVSDGSNVTVYTNVKAKDFYR